MFSLSYFRNIAARTGTVFFRYLRERGGSIMMAFGISLPVVIGSVGFALDMGQAYLVRQRLGAALDASALAGAAMATDPDEIAEKVEEFFAVNYPEEKIGTAFGLEVEVDEDEITVAASARFDTRFMRVLGVRQFTIVEETIVVREVRGLEVVLVLDVTGSMNTNDNISALREAASSFVDILFERTSDPESIKIGIVPYSTSVNVGPYGVGLTPDGEDFDEGEDTGRIFVVDIDDVELDPDKYTTNPNTTTSNAANWYGCVVEYNEDGWDPTVGDNDPYPHDTMDHEGPFLAYTYERYGQDSSCGQTCGWRNGRYRCTNNSCYYPYAYPNYNCPLAHIVPLTSDQDELDTAIAGLTASGNTMGNIGMVWGYRVLSPGFPFTQGAAWEDPEWRKVIIMMTDGDNTLDSHYSGWWRTRNHNLTVTDQDERFVETCDAMKTENGVLIYTVTFYSNIDDETKAYYEDCATTPAQYFDAPSQDELIEVFENISRELANLHIRS